MCNKNSLNNLILGGRHLCLLTDDSSLFLILSCYISLGCLFHLNFHVVYTWDFSILSTFSFATSLKPLYDHWLIDLSRRSHLLVRFSVRPYITLHLHTPLTLLWRCISSTNQRFPLSLYPSIHFFLWHEFSSNDKNYSK